MDLKYSNISCHGMVLLGCNNCTAEVVGEDDYYAHVFCYNLQLLKNKRKNKLLGGNDHRYIYFGWQFCGRNQMK
ncbi:hypothetical protein MKW98_028656 [Papaver atlanticum]|uniref:Uncharacterized protein n=1 Tax=Papaver atlanticum TaxID=357466 RepID=A0AAD4S388_9MAGN|nr:hypothetical protein MKW98_028656 [Papaver atlanticum]